MPSPIKVFKPFMTKDQVKQILSHKKLPMKYNPETHTLQSGKAQIDLILGVAGVGGCVVARKMGKKVYITDDIYAFKREYEKIIKTLKKINLKPDYSVSAPYGLNRIPDCIVDLNFKKSSATAAQKKRIQQKITKLKQALNMTVKQDHLDNLLSEDIATFRNDLKKELIKRVGDKLIKAINLSINTSLKKRKNQSLFLDFNMGLDAKEWEYRVKISETQSVLAFKDGDSYKIRFENENFAPGLSSFTLGKTPGQIYDVIKRNAGVGVSEEKTITAIDLILKEVNGQFNNISYFIVNGDKSKQIKF